MILIAGLPGTGKSTVARAFVQRYGGIHVNSDLIRNSLNLKGQYRPEDKEQVYEAMLENTRIALEGGQFVVVDSTFIRENVRTPFEAVAELCQVPVFWVEVHAAEDTVRERLKTPRSDSEADFSVYKSHQAKKEPIDGPHLELWTDKMELEDMIESIHNYSFQTSL